MVDSQTCAHIHFESDALMRERFVYGNCLLRMGRMMEELDLMAVWICHRHLLLPNLPKGVPLPYTFVTVSVDQAHFLVKKFRTDADVSLSGFVSWTGDCVMEVIAYVRQNGMLLAKAIFIIASRNATNSSPAPINPLKPANEVEDCFYQEALERRKRRASMPSSLAFKRQPTKEEEQIMYDVFTRTKGIEGATPTDMTTLPPDCRWMSKWHRSTFLHPFPEHRNESNTIFGGFIMRNAIEISYMTACLYSNNYPVIRYICDLTFIKAVPVDSYIKLTAYVVYTHENYIQLLTVVDAVCAKCFEESKCYTLQLTYSCNTKVPEILPISYSEALMYLMGRRYFHRFLDAEDREMEGSK
ncbi:acyl-coenzyme A thioesterase 9, mitochondrial isoform X2 [Drosophila eugracilis]|nr:acyl-coenzyme A thioesterase 9, mitochondrial isoform X2 [Drosophila eugracilis]